MRGVLRPTAMLGLGVTGALVVALAGCGSSTSGPGGENSGAAGSGAGAGGDATAGSSGGGGSSAGGTAGATTTAGSSGGAAGSSGSAGRGTAGSAGGAAGTLGGAAGVGGTAGGQADGGAGTGGRAGGGGSGGGAGTAGGAGRGAAGGATGAGGRGGAAGGSGGGAGGAAGGAGGGSGGAAGSVPLDPTLLSRCSGTNPIKCAIPVSANGDYTITVSLGDASAASVARVQAELYRMVVPQLVIAAGAPSLQTFSANVRAETHDGYSAPGMILDLLIDAPATGPAPRLAGLGVAAATSIPTIFVAGDSTVCDWDPALATILDPLERGWAQELSQFLKPGIAVANYADSGETAGSFYTKFFPAARTPMRAGDYLFIQFGHNDQKSTTDVANYQSNLMKYITDARAKSVTPVLFTPVARKSATTADPGFAGLDQQARDLAAAQGVALVDLTNLALAYYKTVPNLSALFATPTEGTHFGESGATQIANLVAGALKSGTLPLSSLVK
jgi:lysophospholipase L1-like esterase